jgi:hypothetical protein
MSMRRRHERVQPQELAGKKGRLVVCRKTQFLKADQKWQDARRLKSFVGNGFKPFPTTYAAMTKDEANAANGHFPSDSYGKEREML